MNSKKLMKIISAGTVSLSMLLSGCASSSSNTSSTEASETVASSENVEKETLFSEKMADLWTVKVNDYTYNQSEYYLYLIQYLFNHGYTADKITDDIKTNAIDSTIYQMRLDALEYSSAKASTEITVDDEKLAEKEKAAESFYKFFGEEFLSEYYITEDMVKELFKRQTYVSAYDDKLITDIAKEAYSQYEVKYKDYTFHNMYYVLFPSYELDADGNTKKDADGNIVQISDEAKAENKKKAEELREKAVAGEALEDLAKEYGVEKYSDKQINLNGSYTEELNKLVESLNDGDISDVVETETGYMIVRMNKRQDDDYKAYWMQYMSYIQAQNSITSMQQKIVSDANLPETDINDYVVMNTDLLSVCERMEKYGVTNEATTTEAATAETTK